MRNFALSATLVASLVGLGTASAWAQAPAHPAAAAPVSNAIAVIDISKIYKEHARFKTAMEGMKKDVTTAEQALNEEAKQLQKLAEQLKEFKPGDPKYKSLEAELFKRKSELDLKASMQKKEFVEREAKYYNLVYNEINSAVAEFAASHGISIVLRYSSDPIDPNDRQSVIQGINRPLVYVAPGLDITVQILAELNRSSGSPAPSTAGRQGPVPH